MRFDKSLLMQRVGTVFEKHQEKAGKKSKKLANLQKSKDNLENFFLKITAFTYDIRNGEGLDEATRQVELQKLQQAYEAELDAQLKEIEARGKECDVSERDIKAAKALAKETFTTLIQKPEQLVAPTLQAIATANQYTVLSSDGRVITLTNSDNLTRIQVFQRSVNGYIPKEKEAAALEALFKTALATRFKVTDKFVLSLSAAEVEDKSLLESAARIGVSLGIDPDNIMFVTKYGTPISFQNYYVGQYGVSAYQELQSEAARARKQNEKSAAEQAQLNKDGYEDGGVKKSGFNTKDQIKPMLVNLANPKQKNDMSATILDRRITTLMSDQKSREQLVAVYVEIAKEKDNLKAVLKDLQGACACLITAQPKMTNVQGQPTEVQKKITAQSNELISKQEAAEKLVSQAERDRLPTELESKDIDFEKDVLPYLSAEKRTAFYNKGTDQQKEFKEKACAEKLAELNGHKDSLEFKRKLAEKRAGRLQELVTAREASLKALDGKIFKDQGSADNFVAAAVSRTHFDKNDEKKFLEETLQLLEDAEKKRYSSSQSFFSIALNKALGNAVVKAADNVTKCEQEIAELKGLESRVPEDNRAKFEKALNDAKQALAAAQTKLSATLEYAMKHVSVKADAKEFAAAAAPAFGMIAERVMQAIDAKQPSDKEEAVFLESVCVTYTKESSTAVSNLAGLLKNCQTDNQRKATIKYLLTYVTTNKISVRQCMSVFGEYNKHAAANNLQQITVANGSVTYNKERVGGNRDGAKHWSKISLYAVTPPAPPALAATPPAPLAS
jgi:hypothetical protein